MNYSNPVYRPNRRKWYPLWKWTDIAYGIAGFGIVLFGFWAAFFQTVASDDPNVIGDIVVDQSIMTSSSSSTGKATVRTSTYILLVEDQETGEQSRVDVPQSYFDVYPEGSTYNGELGGTTHE